MIQTHPQGLPAHIDEDSRVLILGTLPGAKSLQSGRYYADPTNRFWSLLFAACGEAFENTDEAKDALLRKYHIALWDVLASTVREGSSDRALQDEIPNDLPRLLKAHPNIRLLIFHSGDALRYVKRFFKNTSVPYICVSSPSGQNRKCTEEKVHEWRAALSAALPELQSAEKLQRR